MVSISEFFALVSVWIRGYVVVGCERRTIFAYSIVERCNLFAYAGWLAVGDLHLEVPYLGLHTECTYADIPLFCVSCLMLCMITGGFDEMGLGDLE